MNSALGDTASSPRCERGATASVYQQDFSSSCTWHLLDRQGVINQKVRFVFHSTISMDVSVCDDQDHFKDTPMQLSLVLIIAL